MSKLRIKTRRFNEEILHESSSCSSSSTINNRHRKVTENSSSLLVREQLGILDNACEEKRRADKPPASKLEPAISATFELRGGESLSEHFDSNVKNKDLIMTYSEDEQNLQAGIENVISQLSLLVVDDSVIQQKICTFSLSGHHEKELWIVNTADSGEEALEYFTSAETIPDVLIIDYNLDSAGGSLRGSDVVARLRQNSICPMNLIIIGCTGFGSEVAELFISAGVDDCWKKPMPTKDEAVAIINRIRSKKTFGTFGPSLSNLLQCGAGFSSGTNRVSSVLELALDSTLAELRQENVKASQNLLMQYTMQTFLRDDWNQGNRGIPTMRRLANRIDEQNDDESSSSGSGPPVSVVEITGIISETISELSYDGSSTNGDAMDSSHCQQSCDDG